jgi:hypothetical protein
MNPRIFEIPKTLTDLLHSVGPIHEEAVGGYRYVIQVVLRGDNEPAGFVIEQRLCEKELRAAKDQGMTVKAPLRVDHRSEATFVFVESLAAALDYVRRENFAGAEGSGAT